MANVRRFVSGINDVVSELMIRIRCRENKRINAVGDK
jgi:hypothetical protein